jgi:phage terminase large subunit-like protein
MSMDLKEALERVGAVRRHYEAKGDVAAYAPTAEALRVVLAAARENHAAALVADVNRLTAMVLEVTRGDRPHVFQTLTKNTLGFCIVCSGSESDPIHRPVKP